MKVGVYYNNKDVRLEERPRPEIGPGEILIEVAASGICGTDLMEWYRIKKAPRVLGHEVTGIITESKSDKYKVGTRVFVSHHVPCQECKYCLAHNYTACATLHTGNYDPGGYSEYIRIPKINVENGILVLPENVSFDEGTMIEPLACALRAQKVVGLSKEHTVLVLGCGVSGLLNIIAAKRIGAKVIATDISDYRLGKAEEFGADRIQHAEESLKDLNADRVIIATGAYSAAGQAFDAVDRKGTILFFAIPNKDVALPIADFWRNELTVTSSYGAAPDDLAEALDLIAGGKVSVKEFITHTLSLDDIQEGFNITGQAGASLKVVLKPGQHS